MLIIFKNKLKKLKKIKQFGKKFLRTFSGLNFNREQLAKQLQTNKHFEKLSIKVVFLNIPHFKCNLKFFNKNLSTQSSIDFLQPGCTIF